MPPASSPLSLTPNFSWVLKCLRGIQPFQRFANPAPIQACPRGHNSTMLRLCLSIQRDQVARRALRIAVARR
jgi:hypothetical protein